MDFYYLVLQVSFFFTFQTLSHFCSFFPISSLWQAWIKDCHTTVSWKLSGFSLAIWVGIYAGHLEGNKIRKIPLNFLLVLTWYKWSKPKHNAEKRAKMFWFANSNVLCTALQNYESSLSAVPFYSTQRCCYVVELADSLTQILYLAAASST